MSDCINPICAEKGRDHCMNDMPGATCYGYEPTHKTNADRIRMMSDEELAEEILSWYNWLNAVEWDDKRIINWLKQETTDG